MASSRSAILVGLIVFLGSASVTYASGWSMKEIPDEMRGTVSAIATTDAVGPDSTVKGILVLMRDGDGRYGSAIEVKGDRLTCADPCTFSAKFDDGKVLDISAHLFGGDAAIMPYDKKRFFRSIENASRLIVEVSLAGHGLRQFKFSVDGAPIHASLDDKPSILKYPVGTDIKDIEGLSDQLLVGHKDGACFSDVKADVLFSSQVAGLVKACSTKKKLSSVVFSVPRASKSNIRAVDSSIDAVYGKPSDYGTGKMWPDIGNSRGQHHTGAGAYVDGKEVRYVIMDKALSDLEPPKAKK